MTPQIILVSFYNAAALHCILENGYITKVVNSGGNINTFEQSWVEHISNKYM